MHLNSSRKHCGSYTGAEDRALINCALAAPLEGRLSSLSFWNDCKDGKHLTIDRTAEACRQRFKRLHEKHMANYNLTAAQERQIHERMSPDAAPEKKNQKKKTMVSDSCEEQADEQTRWVVDVGLGNEVESSPSARKKLKFSKMNGIGKAVDDDSEHTRHYNSLVRECFHESLTTLPDGKVVGYRDQLKRGIGVAWKHMMCVAPWSELSADYVAERVSAAESTAKAWSQYNVGELMHKVAFVFQNRRSPDPDVVETVQFLEAHIDQTNILLSAVAGQAAEHGPGKTLEDDHPNDWDELVREADARLAQNQDHTMNLKTLRDVETVVFNSLQKERHTEK